MIGDRGVRVVTVTVLEVFRVLRERAALLPYTEEIKNIFVYLKRRQT